MPAGDGTGPMGLGPRTGRAAGYCADYSVPGYSNGWVRMGMGFRRGFLKMPQFGTAGTGRGMGGGRGRGGRRGRWLRGW